MRHFVPLAAIALVAGAIPASAQRNEAADRAEIHALLMAYGSTLDARDFDGFSKLFGTDGVYVGGGAGMEAKGPAAGVMMRKVFADNQFGVREPNFHLFYNEVVTFDGPDRARATSMSLWMVPDDKNRPTPLMSGRYEDQIVRKDGKWLFARREVKRITNTPAAK
jgi:hypothetical protein